MHLFYVLEQQIEREQFPQEQAERYLGIPQRLSDPEIRRVYRQRDPDRLSGILLEYGQNIFDRYVTYADFGSRIRNTAIRTPGSCLTVNR
ncbi:hypothetical protein LNQ03_08065 [Klebsiella pneumoniae subsp. pneumoniae]|nr:hypothetical protein [Klebsiella pneumoniae subsp. pneumoniae]